MGSISRDYSQQLNSDDVLSVAAELPPRLAKCNIQWLMEGQARLPSALGQMRFNELRKGQEEPITMIMSGRDTIVILPTGTGKTAVFVLPTLAMNWRTLVFSPLVALMKDQVDSLRRKDIRAAALSGMQTDAQNQSALLAWMRGELSLLYVAPERLGNEQFRTAMRHISPDMVVLDEAHCLSAWSDNFRSDYCKTGWFIAEFQPKVVAAFTATCPPEVEADVRRVMAIPEACQYLYYPRRTNLMLTSSTLESDYDLVKLAKQSKGSFIIYCSSIKRVEQTAKFLQDNLNEDVGIFHGDLQDSVKPQMMDNFMHNKVRGMVATSAFGMGVDKPDIRMVAHRDYPGSLEALMQELGRAGRDGFNALCMTFTSPESLRTQQFFLDSGYPSRDKIMAVYDAIYSRMPEGGRLQMTGEEMVQATGLHSRYISTVMQLLAGARVIDRRKIENKVATIMFVGDTDDEKFKAYKGFIIQGGKKVEIPKDAANPGGGIGYQVDLNWLALRCGVQYNTVRSRLVGWNTNGLIKWTPPFRGKDTCLIGSIDRVDFDRIREKGILAYAKLDQVLQYLDLPDEEKHDYLEGYFARTTELIA